MEDVSKFKQMVSTALKSLDKNDPNYYDKANKIMNYYEQKMQGTSTIGVDADTFNKVKEEQSKLRNIVGEFGKVTGTAKDMTLEDMREAEKLIGITTPTNPGVGKGLKLADETQDTIKKGTRTALSNIAAKSPVDPNVDLGKAVRQLAKKTSAPRGAKFGEDVTGDVARRLEMNTAINAEKAGLTKYAKNIGKKALGSLGALGALASVAATGDVSAASPIPGMESEETGPAEGTPERLLETGKIDLEQYKAMQDPNSEYNKTKRIMDEKAIEDTKDIRKQALLRLGNIKEDGGIVNNPKRSMLQKLKNKR